MTADDTVVWLKNYFSQKAALPDDVEGKNYFELGLIDSLEVIMLIEEIETSYAIKFNEEHFQDRRFSTIKGLADMIMEIKG